VTALRGGWGVFMPRREQGLSKMMAYSMFLHICLFLFMILNRVFFAPQTTSFQGFQVDLLSSGPGIGLSGGGGGPKPRSVKKSAPKKSPKAAVKTSPPAPKKASAKPAAPKPAPAKASVKPALPPLQAAPEAAPSVTRAPRRSVNAPAAEKEDPERLQEWWKKQKKALKTPSVTPGIKPKMGVSERTRTAKIDIQKQPNIVPPALALPEAAPKTIPQASGALPKEPAAPETTSPSAEDNASASEEEPDGAATEQSDEALSQPDNEASMQAALGPGISGVGPSGGNSSFLFPNYLQKIDHKIRWRWAPPPVTASGDRLVIRFVIQKNGSIDKSSVEIAESSGNLFFDQAAIRAIHAAHPLPPLPKAYREDLLIVFMNFVVREDS